MNNLQLELLKKKEKLAELKQRKLERENLVSGYKFLNRNNYVYLLSLMQNFKIHN